METMLAKEVVEYREHQDNVQPTFLHEDVQRLRPAKSSPKGRAEKRVLKHIHNQTYRQQTNNKQKHFGKTNFSISNLQINNTILLSGRHLLNSTK